MNIELFCSSLSKIFLVKSWKDSFQVEFLKMVFYLIILGMTLVNYKNLRNFQFMNGMMLLGLCPLVSLFSVSFKKSRENHLIDKYRKNTKNITL